MKRSLGRPEGGSASMEMGDKKHRNKVHFSNREGSV